MSNSPEPVRLFETTDEQLSAELRKWTGASPALNPVGELLDRHWESAFAYARLCTDGARAAGMLTTTAFTRLFGQSLRQSGPTAAWRPQILVTVRRIAAEWSADHRRAMLHPDLSAAAAGPEGVAAHLLPPAGRRLLSRAFQRLPQSARALLWHTEVEAEPLAVPAALLGLNEEGARIELRRARERLREECLQVHRELAPEQICLRYARLLDVTSRRGGAAVDPDLREHLAGCTHCRHTADQLGQFGTDLGTALAEGVLGWGARAYRASRAGGEEPAVDEPAAPPAPAPTAPFAPSAPTGGAPFLPAATDGVFPGAEPLTTPPQGGIPGGEPFDSTAARVPVGGESADAAPGVPAAAGESFGTPPGVPPGVGGASVSGPGAVSAGDGGFASGPGVPPVVGESFGFPPGVPPGVGGASVSGPGAVSAGDGGFASGPGV
ncbi:hydrolase, partial [Streptomyces sp. NPDC046831]